MRRGQTGRNPEHQVGLFEALSDRPRWLDLPADSQRKVIDLLGRMLREDRCQKAVRAAQEGEDE